MQKMRWIVGVGDDAYKDVEKGRADVVLIEDYYDEDRGFSVDVAILVSDAFETAVSALFPEGGQSTIEGVACILIEAESYYSVLGRLADHFELHKWVRDLSTLEWKEV